MTVFRGSDAIEEFLADLEGWLSEAVDVYLVGGSAMTVEGLKDQTQDIDLAFGVVDEFEHVRQTLTDQGFEIVGEPTAELAVAGETVELRHAELGYRIDIFERQIVGKVWLSERMHDRATEFWSGSTVTAFVVADEDMFLLKAVAGGDLGAGRRRDIEDLRMYAQRGLDYGVIVDEIEAQRPFNQGSPEATLIRTRSHPLLAIDIAVDSLAGLPTDFTEQIERIATGLEWAQDKANEGLTSPS